MMNALEEKGFSYVGRRHKPLCGTERGLLTYHRGALYLYRDGTFALFAQLENSFKQKILSSTRLLERLGRSEPQSAVTSGNCVYLARHNGVFCFSLETGKMIDRLAFRKPYIHTSRMALIKDVPSFEDAVAFGEYFANEKREEVCIWTRSASNTGEWKVAYTFPARKVRHVHSLIPAPHHSCVYILTGDEDGESGIWKATDNFKTVEPVLVGDQAYRACIAFVDGDGITFATDIPSRQNHISRYQLNTGTFTTIADLPGSCTSGCMVNGKRFFCTAVESEEPETRSKADMLKYMFSKKRAAGILDNSSHVLMENENGGYEEYLHFEKDCLPGGAFRFGNVFIVHDENSGMTYFYPCSVKKYDGRLYSIRLADADTSKN